jgi:hypothetical protein
VLTMVGLWLARDPVDEAATPEPTSEEVLT